MATLTLSLLGPFAAFLDERPLTKFTTNRVQALLIYLAVEAVATPLRRDTLMGILWPELPQESAQTNLRQTLYRLRKMIPELSRRDGDGSVPFLLADRKTVQINPNGRFNLDRHNFKTLLKQDESHWPEAIALYRGSFLADFYLPDSAPFEEWAESHRSSLLRQMLDALDALTAHDIAAGDFELAETYARRQLELDNLRESAHRQLMEVLVRNGRRRAALSHYETCCQLLQNELDIEPSAETQALYKKIRSGELDTAKQEPITESPLHPFVPSSKQPQIAHNLPPTPTPFIGRENELAALDDLIANPDVRLITIVGPGGMGKTRLALACAEQQLAAPLKPDYGSEPRFPNGIYFVSLAPLSSTKHIIPALVDALNFPLRQEKRPPKQQILDYLREKQTLLIFDNFEHLLDGIDLLADILQVAPDIHILTTSRERLHLQEEQLFAIQGLKFPESEPALPSPIPENVVEYAAARLFLQSAQRIKHDFTLQPGDFIHLTHICRLVEGMPLGIELAASWVDMLPLADIIQEIQSGLDFLETDMRNIPARHRNLRAVVDTSWQHLNKKERAVFCQSSVFRGGFTRRAAEQVMGASLYLLSRLANKSLLNYNQERDRYYIHELLRQYAAEKLAQDSNLETDIRDRHCKYFCQALHDRTDDLKGGRQREAMLEIGADIENVRAAWDWAVTHEYLAQLHQAASSLGIFYYRYGRHLEGEIAFRSAADMCQTAQLSDEQTSTMAYLLFGLALCVSSTTERNALLEESLSQMNRLEQVNTKTKGLKAEILDNAGYFAAISGEREKGQQMLQESLALFQEIGDLWGMSEVLSSISERFMVSCQYDLAEQYVCQSLDIQRQIHNWHGIAFNQMRLGYIYLNQNFFQKATQCFQESLKIYQDQGYRWYATDLLTPLAIAKTLQYDSLDEAERLYLECLTFYNNFGNKRGQSLATGWIACIKVLERREKEAEFLAQSALNQAREMTRDNESAWALCVLCYTALSTEDFAKAQTLAQEAVTIYYNLNMPSEFSNGLIPLSWALVAQSRYTQAEQPIYEILKIWNNGTFHALPIAACILAHRAQTTADKEYALRLIGLYEQVAPWAAAPLFQFLTTRFLPDSLFDMPSDKIRAIKAEGRTLNPDVVIEEILQKLPDLGWQIKRPKDLETPQLEEKVGCSSEQPQIAHNLPPTSTPFIGRENELAALDGLIASPDIRLITIVGPGGIGKTRLALACAEQQLAAPLNPNNGSEPRFPKGIYFAPLSPLNEIEQIVPSLALIFKFQLQGDTRTPKQQILDYLRQKRMLLVMDNFEHLLDGANLLVDILQTAPDVQILVTSREPLNLYEEQQFAIQGLEFPDLEELENVGAYTAVQLFLQSARRIKHNFTLQTDDFAILTHICRLVDGIPLALELAAAWVDTLPLADIASEIETSLDFLEANWRNMPDRHRSMRAVFDSIWNHLTDAEQNMLLKLSVFRGGFTRQAATAVAGAPLHQLAGLVNKSLLQLDQPHGRYQLHELLRQFGAEKLTQLPDQKEAIKDHHSSYYCAFLQKQDAKIKGPHQQEAVAEIEIEHENARSAWEWAVERERIDWLDQALDGLCRYYEWQGLFQDVEPVCRLASDKLMPSTSGDDLRVLARILAWQGLVLSDDSDRQLLQRSLSLLEKPELKEYDTRAEQAFALRRMGRLAQDKEIASRSYKQSLYLYQELGDRWNEAKTLASLAQNYTRTSGYVQIEKWGEEALAIRQKLGDKSGIASSLSQLATFAREQGQTDKAEALFQQSLRLSQALNNQPFIASSLYSIAILKASKGQFAECQSFLKDNLEIVNDLGARLNAAFAYAHLGWAAVHLGNYTKAQDCLKVSSRIFLEHSSHFGQGFNYAFLSMVELAKKRHIEARNLGQNSLSVFRELDFTHFLGLALAYSAYAERGLNNLDLSQQYVVEALQLTIKSPFFDTLLETLPIAALLLVDLGKKERAIEIYSLAASKPFVANSQWFEDVAGQHIKAAATSLPPELVKVAEERGRARDFWETAKGLLETDFADAGIMEKSDRQRLLESDIASQQAVEWVTPAPRFAQKSLITTGGHGELYLGEDTVTGRRVIIKRLKPEMVAQYPEIVARFIREGEALRQLNHPNIVKMLAAEERDNAHLIIMEYVPGGSLRELLDAEGQLPVRRVLDIGLELADALTRAHHLAIIHRDIKPANVLLAADGTPRLTDFGIAYFSQRETRLTQAGSFMGSPVYMSPEACQGEELDARSDIWSFGALLYEMLAGRPPFANEQITATLIAILNDPIPDLNQFRPETPLRLEALINSMLIKEQEKRISSVRQVAAELEIIRKNLATN